MPPATYSNPSDLFPSTYGWPLLSVNSCLIKSSKHVLLPRAPGRCDSTAGTTNYASLVGVSRQAVIAAVITSGLISVYTLRGGKGVVK